MKKKVCWTLEPRTIATLKEMRAEAEKACKRKVSLSELIDEVIRKVEDPLQRKKKEGKELAIRLNQIQDEIKELEKKGL